MRNALLIVLLTGISFHGQAQQLSVGYKTGINNWIRINTSKERALIQETKNGDKISWNNELFARYQTKKNLAFEAGISYTRRKMNGMDYVYGCFGPSYTTTGLENMNYIELNIGIQYKINIPCTDKCQLLNRMSNYIGISAHPQLLNVVSEYAYSGENTPPVLYQPVRDADRYIMCSVGLNHTLIYNISKQFNAISNVSLKYRPDSKYSYISNTRVGVSLGTSYNLN